MPALRELIGRYGVDVATHLDRDADIPVLTAPQIQGDVSIRPVRRPRFWHRHLDRHWWPVERPIPPEGVAVITGGEGHQHRLLPGPGRFDWVTVSSRPLLIGILTVPAGCEQYLAHDQHGYLGIGPGTYEVGRQREWTPATHWRNVLD
jgi:hypothetical protein